VERAQLLVYLAQGLCIQETCLQVAGRGHNTATGSSRSHAVPPSNTHKQTCIEEYSCPVRAATRLMADQMLCRSSEPACGAGRHSRVHHYDGIIIMYQDPSVERQHYDWQCLPCSWGALTAEVLPSYRYASLSSNHSSYPADCRGRT
jgi:hypothetical protein